MGFVVSKMVLCLRCSFPANDNAFSAPLHFTDKIITSPNSATSSKLPMTPLNPCSCFRSSSQDTVRDHIIMSYPRFVRPIASVFPTVPDPRIPILNIVVAKTKKGTIHNLYVFANRSQ